MIEKRRLLLQNKKGNKYFSQYLTIVSLADNNLIKWKCSDSASTSHVKYINISTDNGATWTRKLSSYAGTTLALLNNGDKMLVKRYNTSSYGFSDGYHNCFTSTQNFNVEGNIMSMIIDGDFTTATTISSTYAFYRLFYNCVKLNSAENLILPATALKSYCYYSMFGGCTSLTTAPSLPATTLETQCYESMFYGCSALTTAPILSAATLRTDCYQAMFQGCSKLKSITCLATNLNATDCTKNWVDGVAASGTFTKAASMSNWNRGVNGIPSSWTVKNI